MNFRSYNTFCNENFWEELLLEFLKASHEEISLEIPSKVFGQDVLHKKCLFEAATLLSCSKNFQK